MSSSPPEISPAHWETLIDQFIASGLTKVAFCKEKDISIYAFSYRYRRSDKFKGVRKGSTRSSDDQASGFRPVHKKQASTNDQSLEMQSVSIRIGADVHLQCSASVGIEAIVRLAREAQS